MDELNQQSPTAQPTYADLLNVWDKVKDHPAIKSRFPDMGSLYKYASQIPGGEPFRIGANPGLIKNIAARTQNAVNSTGIPEFTGNVMEGLFDSVGADKQAGKQFGESLPLGLATSVAAGTGAAGLVASGPVGWAGLGYGALAVGGAGLAGAQTYADTDSPVAGIISGGTQLAFPSAMGWAEKKLAAPLALKLFPQQGGVAQKMAEKAFDAMADAGALTAVNEVSRQAISVAAGQGLAPVFTKEHALETGLMAAPIIAGKSFGMFRDQKIPKVTVDPDGMPTIGWFSSSADFARVDKWNKLQLDAKAEAQRLCDAIAATKVKSSSEKTPIEEQANVPTTEELDAVMGKSPKQVQTPMEEQANEPPEINPHAVSVGDARRIMISEKSQNGEDIPAALLNPGEQSLLEPLGYELQDGVWKLVPQWAKEQAQQELGVVQSKGFVPEEVPVGPQTPQIAAGKPPKIVYDADAHYQTYQEHLKNLEETHQDAAIVAGVQLNTTSKEQLIGANKIETIKPEQAAEKLKLANIVAKQQGLKQTSVESLMDEVDEMSANPAILGVAKGRIVDAEAQHVQDMSDVKQIADGQVNPPSPALMEGQKQTRTSITEPSIHRETDTITKQEQYIVRVPGEAIPKSFKSVEEATKELAGKGFKTIQLEGFAGVKNLKLKFAEASKTGDYQIYRSASEPPSFSVRFKGNMVALGKRNNFLFDSEEAAREALGAANHPDIPVIQTPSMKEMKEHLKNLKVQQEDEEAETGVATPQVSKQEKAAKDDYVSRTETLQETMADVAEHARDLTPENQAIITSAMRKLQSIFYESELPILAEDNFLKRATRWMLQKQKQMETETRGSERFSSMKQVEKNALLRKTLSEDKAVVVDKENKVRVFNKEEANRLVQQDATNRLVTDPKEVETLKKALEDSQVNRAVKMKDVEDELMRIGQGIAKTATKRAKGYKGQVLSMDAPSSNQGESSVVRTLLDDLGEKVGMSVDGNLVVENHMDGEQLVMQANSEKMLAPITKEELRALVASLKLNPDLIEKDMSPNMLSDVSIKRMNMVMELMVQGHIQRKWGTVTQRDAQNKVLYDTSGKALSKRSMVLEYNDWDLVHRTFLASEGRNFSKEESVKNAIRDILKKDVLIETKDGKQRYVKLPLFTWLVKSRMGDVTNTRELVRGMLDNPKTPDSTLKAFGANEKLQQKLKAIKEDPNATNQLWVSRGLKETPAAGWVSSNEAQLLAGTEHLPQYAKLFYQDFFKRRGYSVDEVGSLSDVALRVATAFRELHATDIASIVDKTAQAKAWGVSVTLKDRKVGSIGINEMKILGADKPFEAFAKLFVLAHESNHRLMDENAYGRLSPERSAMVNRAMQTAKELKPLERQALIKDLLKIVVPDKYWQDQVVVHNEGVADKQSTPLGGKTETKKFLEDLSLQASHDPEEFLATFGGLAVLGSASPGKGGTFHFNPKTKESFLFMPDKLHEFAQGHFTDVINLTESLRDYLLAKGTPSNRALLSGGQVEQWWNEVQHNFYAKQGEKGYKGVKLFKTSTLDSEGVNTNKQNLFIPSKETRSNLTSLMQQLKTLEKAPVETRAKAVETTANQFYRSLSQEQRIKLMGEEKGMFDGTGIERSNEEAGAKEYLQRVLVQELGVESKVSLFDRVMQALGYDGVDFSSLGSNQAKLFYRADLGEKIPVQPADTAFKPTSFFTKETPNSADSLAALTNRIQAYDGLSKIYKGLIAQHTEMLACQHKLAELSNMIGTGLIDAGTVHSVYNRVKPETSDRLVHLIAKETGDALTGKPWGIEPSFFEKVFMPKTQLAAKYPFLWPVVDLALNHKGMVKNFLTELYAPFMVPKGGKLVFDEKGGALHQVLNSEKMSSALNEICMTEQEKGAFMEKGEAQQLLTAKGFSPEDQTTIMNLRNAMASGIKKSNQLKFDGAARQGLETLTALSLLNDAGGDATKAHEWGKQFATAMLSMRQAEFPKTEDGRSFTINGLVDPLQGEQMMRELQSKLTPERFAELQDEAEPIFKKAMTMGNFLLSRPWYIPESRPGKYFVSFDKPGEDGKPAHHFEGYYNKNEAESRYNEVKQQGGVENLKAIDKSVQTSERNLLHSQMIRQYAEVEQQAFERTKQRLLEQDPDMADAIEKFNFRFGRAAMQEAQSRGMNANMMQRKLVAGRERINFAQNTLEYFQNVSRGMAKKYTSDVAALYLADQQMKANPAVRKEMMDYMSMVVNPPSNEMSGIKNLVFHWTLGGNLSSLLVERLQPLFSLIPELMNAKDVHGAPVGLGDAYKKTWNAMGLVRKMASGENLTPNELVMRKQLQRAIDSGNVDAGIYNELASSEDLAMVNMHNLAQGKTAVQKTTDLLTKPLWHYGNFVRNMYTKASTVNSHIAFVTGWLRAKELGLNDEQAYTMGTRMCHTTMFTGGSAARPGLFNNLGKLYGAAGVWYTLQHFTFSSIAMMHRLMSDSFHEKGLDAGQVKAAKRALATMTATQMFAAGAFGMPLVGLTASMIENVFGVDVKGNMRKFIANRFDDEEDGGIIADHVLNGSASRTLGMGVVDVSSRFSLGSALGLDQNNGPSWADVGGPAGSVITQTAKSLGNAFKGITDGSPDEVKGGMIGAMPTALKNFANFFAQGNDIKNAKGQLLYQASDAEKWLKAIGLRPKELSMRQEESRLLQKTQENADRQNQEFNKEMAKMLLAGHAGDVRAALVERARNDSMFDPHSALSQIVKLAQDQTLPVDPRMQGSRSSAQAREELSRTFGSRQMPSEVSHLMNRVQLEQQVSLPGHQPQVTPHLMQEAQLVDRFVQLGYSRMHAQVLAERMLARTPQGRGMF